MLSKSQIKHIQSLRLGKHRQRSNTFVAEGAKIVLELLHSDLTVLNIYAEHSWLDTNAEILEQINCPKTTVSDKELHKISFLNTPNQALALVEIPDNNPLNPINMDQGLYLALDDIRDPGNMGTIIRTADWFGVNGIFCSPQCVDIYNPKVVQATMGSIGRIPVFSTDLIDLINRSELASYATTLGGVSINNTQPEKNSLLVIGNESRGLSSEIANACNYQITIPKFGNAESLNAAMAVGILLATFRLG